MARAKRIKMNRLQLSAQILLAITAIIFCVSCAKSDKLHPLTQVKVESVATTSVTVNFCTDSAYDQKQYLKTIVILDHSGSNQQNYLMAADGSGAPALVNGVPVVSKQYATDPTGHTRYGDVNTSGTLLNYLSTLAPNNPTDPTRYFALIDFSDSAVTYPKNASGFTSDTVDFFNHVLADSGSTTGGPNDSGSTSYLSALGAAYNIINNDIQGATDCAALPLGSPSPGPWCLHPGVQVASSYVIVFMSDGSPITNISGIGVDSNGNLVVTGKISITKEPTDQILGQVATIASLASNSKFVTSVNFFTIYYYYPGNIDLSGQQLLADMAKAGNGIAYNALSGSNINYSSFQPPQKRIKYTLSDVFVTNASTTWWNDGKLHLDTDMDGLPDDVEIAWGSDPNNPNTDGNGVSDLVKYQVTNAKPCTKRNSQGICIDPVTNYHKTICSSLPFPYSSSDPDGLNDCEKLVLNDAGGINNPDSNSDLVPDWLEFKNGIPFQIGTAPAVTTPDLDGNSIYQKIKFSLPVNIPSGQLVNLNPANYNMQLLSTNSTQDCYKLNVINLPTIGDGNTVRVDIVEKSELLNSNYLYRVGQKAFPAGSLNLQFNDWNDAGEIAASTWKNWP